MFSMSRSVAVIATVLSFLSVSLSRRLSEEERVKLWKQNNEWPPVWQPETDGKSHFNKAQDLGHSVFLINLLRCIGSKIFSESTSCVLYFSCVLKNATSLLQKLLEVVFIIIFPSDSRAQASNLCTRQERLKLWVFQPLMKDGKIGYSSLNPD